MVRRIPPASKMGGLKRDREQANRRITDLERVDGSQYGRILERIKGIYQDIVDLTDNLADTVQTYIGIYSRTRSEIDSKNASQDSAIAGKEDSFGTLSPGKGGSGTTNAYSNDLSSSTRRAQWVSSSGVMGYAPSVFALKSDVQVADIPIRTWLDQPVRAFRWRAEDDSLKFDLGFIAEDLADAGLEQWLYRSTDGELEGVAYERLSLAHHEIVRHLNQVVLNQQTQIDALVERVTILEETS